MSAFDWKWVVIGACVAFTVYIAVIPLGFLLWQSFRTPQTAAVDAVFTLGNYAAAYGSAETLAAVLDLDPVRVGHGDLRVRRSAPRSRG